MCLVFQRVMSRPTSLMRVWATPTSMPSMRVRSTPLIRASSWPRSNCGVGCRLPAAFDAGRAVRGGGGRPVSGRCVGTSLSATVVRCSSKRPVAFGDALLVGVVQVTSCCRTNKQSACHVPSRLRAISSRLARMRGWLSAASVWGSRSPAGWRARCACPVQPAEIADHVRQLDVHLGERLLHPLDAGAEAAHVIAPLAPIGPCDADLGWRMERIAEQAVGVQLQQPLALLHVALAPGQILRVAGVDQIDLESAGVEDLVQRHPIDAGRLHRDRRHAALLEPVGQPMQVGRETLEPAHRIGVAIRSDGDVVGAVATSMPAALGWTRPVRVRGLQSRASSLRCVRFNPTDCAAMRFSCRETTAARGR